MTTTRLRRSKSRGLNGGDMSESTEKERMLGFSDDEDAMSMPGIFKAESASTATTKDRTMLPDIASELVSESAAASQFSDEVEGDIEIFNKAVHITNLEKVDHGKLLRKMHERFKKKVTKWERLAYYYSKYSFAMNFAILVLQLLQMILQQTASLWEMENRDSEAEKRQGRSFFQNLGIYKWSQWSRNTTAEQDERGLLYYALQPQSTQTVHSILMAATALLAGLQLKLKMNEKAEKYRRGAKVYGRLLRVSTYYIMMIESGGKIEDVTGLWREAMKKEGKWIPLVRTFLPM